MEGVPFGGQRERGTPSSETVQPHGGAWVVGVQLWWSPAALGVRPLASCLVRGQPSQLCVTALGDSANTSQVLTVHRPCARSSLYIILSNS
jgi:hypothetical protein